MQAKIGRFMDLNPPSITPCRMKKIAHVVIFQGTNGVAKVLQILQDELKKAMALSGERMSSSDQIMVKFPAL